jgi:LPS O-antigen subunit length determinant protein (WzzB/FepE family)
LVQNEPINSTLKIAKASGVSASTVKRDAIFAKQVDESPELLKAVGKNELKKLDIKLIRANHSNMTKGPYVNPVFKLYDRQKIIN